MGFRSCAARFLTLATACGLLSAGCGDESAAGAPSAASSAPSSISELEAFDGLLRGLAECPFDAKSDVDPACPGAAALIDWHRRQKSWMEAHSEEAAAVARRYLEDRSPAIRSVAFQMLGWRIKRNDPAARADVVKGGKWEQDPRVMKAIVDAAAKDAAEASMQAVLTGALDSPDERVRRAAINGLLPQTSEKPPAARVLDVIEKDASPALRRLACERLRPYGDAAVKATFDRVLTSAEPEAGVFEGCFYGLVLNWASRAGPAPDRQAYERSLELVEKGARDARRPYGIGLHLMSIAMPAEEAKKADQAWFEQARVFVVRERIVAAIKALLLDAKASDDNRSDAYFALLGLGMEPSQTGLSATDLERLSKPRSKAPTSP